MRPKKTDSSAETQAVFQELAGTKQGKATRSATAGARNRAVMEAYRRMARQGWENVTIVNLHPFQLNYHQGALGNLTVPARKDNEAYAIKYLDRPVLAMNDEGDDKWTPIPVVPKEMAEALCAYYKDRGGVFCYEGNGAPDPDELADAVAKQHEWYFRLIREAQANWQQYPKNPKYISQRMVDAAKELFRLQLIDEAPEWTIISKADSPDFPCEMCGQLIPKVAAFCKECHTIYDVEKVKALRPDIWLAQNPPEKVSKAGFDPGVEGLIVNEEE